jgi:hypothetical protein
MVLARTSQSPELVARSPEREFQALFALLDLVQQALFLHTPLALRTQSERNEDDGGQRIGDVGRAAAPPRRVHHHDLGQFVLAPHAVVVGGLDPERVATGIEVGIGRVVLVAGFHPVGVEVLEPIAEPVLRRRDEIQRRVAQAQHARGLLDPQFGARLPARAGCDCRRGPRSAPRPVHSCCPAGAPGRTG